MDSGWAHASRVNTSEVRVAGHSNTDRGRHKAPSLVNQDRRLTGELVQKAGAWEWAWAPYQKHRLKWAGERERERRMWGRVAEVGRVAGAGAGATGPGEEDVGTDG